MSPLSVTMIARTFHGIQNDAQFFDGWRTYGDAWARRYLLAVRARGCSRVHRQSTIDAADAALDEIEVHETFPR